MIDPLNNKTEIRRRGKKRKKVHMCKGSWAHKKEREKITESTIPEEE
jgi:hypothetical protein